MVSAVIFDLDGTLTMTPNPWRHIHERMGVWDAGACTHLDDWLAGRLTYEEFCLRDTTLWKGRALPEIYGYLDEIELNRHVPEVVRVLMKEDIPSVIISSGFRYVAHRIQVKHRWESLTIHANDLLEGPEVRLHVSQDPLSPLCKRTLGRDALQGLGVDASQVLAVSDAVRDLEQLRDCGFHLHIQKEDDLFDLLSYFH